MNRPSFARLVASSLLGGASLLSMTTAAEATRILFTSSRALDPAALAPGREVTLVEGTTQLRLDNGAIASFVGPAQFALRSDGSIDLRRGTVTIANGASAETLVHLPAGVRGRIAGAGSAGSFTAGPDGARGSAMTGRVAITAANVTQVYAAGQFWAALAGRAPDRVIANAAADATVAAAAVRPLRTSGIAGAAEAGLPIALGEALAGVGASGDVVAAAGRIEAFDRNPALAAFPAGDYATLTRYAAQLAAAYGTPAFNGAGADIVRTYLQFIATGRAGADFRSAYAATLLAYLDLVRSGALPSSFGGATQAQLDAYIAFIARTDGFGQLSAANRQLLEAYVAFLSSGGQRDAFGANASALVTAYLDFLRAGGSPAAFQQASASVIAQYLAILQSGGLKARLSAENQALLDALIANGGIGFQSTYATALAAFVAHLDAGGLPSAYAALDAATVRQYLETLQRTGLFNRVLGAQAGFLSSYLAYLQAGGTPDRFEALPANIQTAQAAALSAFGAYLEGGGLPSGYGALTAEQVRSYLANLSAAGRLSLTGRYATLFSGYLAYLNGGGAVDGYVQLPINVLTAQAAALDAFYGYIQSGGLPSGYEALTADQVRTYLAALQASGLFERLVGANATFFADYYAYLAAGGAIDNYGGLPTVDLTAYAAAVDAFVAYLRAGGLPSGYSALTAAQVRTYLIALQASGRLAELTGANADFLAAYLAYLRTGAPLDQYAGLPIATYNAYAQALSAFVAYLRNGGLPSAYTALTADQVRAYLETLATNGQLEALTGDSAALLTAYLDYLRTGAAPDQYAGLPIVTYQGYASALAAFFAYLNAGGLPSAYTALTAEQIRSYIAALEASGQLAALVGAQGAAYFSAYLSYVAAGGAPDSYAALPIVTYRSYASALASFYAYLQADGRPSAYTALSAGQVRAYLEALRASGQFTALLGANAGFFDGYLTYLQSGAAPDQYAALPVNIGVAALPAPNHAYAGDFTPRGGRAGYVVGVPGQNGATVPNSFSTASAQPTLNASGGVTRLFAGTDAGNARVTDVAGNDRVLIGRWTEGNVRAGGNARALSPTQALHYYAVQPATFLMPVGGRIDYRLLAATQPTFASGYGNAGLFDARLAIAFGTAPRIGIEGTIRAPERDGVHDYAFASSGGTAAPSLVPGLIRPDALRFTTALTGSGQACTAGDCTIEFDGGFSGVNADALALGYVTRGGAHSLIGTAAFVSTNPQAIPGDDTLAEYGRALNAFYDYLATGRKPSTYTLLSQAQVQAYLEALYAAGATAQVDDYATFFEGYLGYLRTGGNPDTYVDLPAAPPTDQILSTRGQFVKLGAAGSYMAAVVTRDGSGQGFSASANGAVTFAGDLPTTIGNVDRGTARTLDAAGDQFISIGRWTDGNVTRSGAAAAMNANQALHYMVASPTFTLPATGTADYALFAATAPTWNRADLPPGLFDARLRVAFGSSPRVAALGTLSMGETSGLVTYAFGSQALLDNVASQGQPLSVGTNALFSQTLTGAGAACPAGVAGCTISFRGAVAGENAARIGYTYLTNAGSSAPSIAGAAIFAKAGTFDGTAPVPDESQLAAQTASLEALATALRGGTKPSAYAALNPTQTQAAYSALAAAGRLGGVGTAETVGFLAGYVGWLNTGGTADSYAGLPPPAGLPAPAYSYAPGLPTAGVTVANVTRTSNTTVSSTYTQAGITLGADGGLNLAGTANASGSLARGTAQQRERWGDAHVLIGRWSGGTYLAGANGMPLTGNQSLHYALVAPGTFNVPYRGRIDYQLAAATQPTFVDGHTGPGLFDAAMAIHFANRPRVGLVGTIRMPEQAGTTTYSFATPGGLDAPTSATATDIVGGARHFNIGAPVTGTGDACTTQCVLNVSAFLADSPLYVGATYFLSDSRSNQANAVTGAASFTGRWIGDDQSYQTVTTGNFIADAGLNEALSPSSANGGRSSYDINAAGQIIGVTAQNGLTDRLGSARIAESGASVPGGLNWTRWTDGALEITRFGPAFASLSANQGYHIITGAPLSALPASGTFNYTLAGGSTPTDRAGRYAPGTLVSGSAAVSFGSTVRVGLDVTAQMDGKTYNMFTTGRLADLAQSELTVDSSGRFSTSSGPATSTGTDCAAGSCRVMWNGFLSGAGASGLGAEYKLVNSTGPALIGVLGFNKGAAVTPPGAATDLSAAPSGSSMVVATSGLLNLTTPADTVTITGGQLAGVSNANIQIVRGTAASDSSGSIAQQIGWSRWVGPGDFTQYNANTLLGSGTGIHFVWGTPATNVPASGLVTYDSVGATVTSAMNPAREGSASGRLGVDFATRKVGWSMTVQYGTVGVGFGSPGLDSNPSVALTAGHGWAGSADAGVGQGGTARGFLAGPGASHAGMAFDVDMAGFGYGTVSGVIAFQKR